jgi:hypothetical protein
MRWRYKRPEGGARRRRHWRRQWRLGAQGNAHGGEFNPFCRRACLEEGVTTIHDMGTVRQWRRATANSSAGAARRAYDDVAVGRSAWRAWTRGARGEDQDGGSARAVETHGPGVRSLPRHAGPAWSRRGRCATPARQRVLDAKDQRPIRLALFDRRFLKILKQKWTRRPIGKL